jgi:type I restriction enzyme S subunit
MSSVVPNGWDSKRLGDVASLIMGQSPTSDTYNDEKNGTPFFQGKADFGVKYPKVRYWCTSPTKIAPIDSILFSVRAPVGAVNLNNIEACIGRGLASISGKSIDNTFLYQSLIHAKVKFEALGQGSTFEAINGNELKEFSLVCPPLPEQKKIASILTSVDEVIENTQKQIDKLQDLKKATMNELLTKGIGHTEFKDSELGRIPKTWEVISVGQYAKSIVPGRNKPASLDGNIPWITITDLEKFSVSKSKQNLGVDKNILKSAGGKTVPARSVILSVVGEFGISSLAEVELVINQQLHGFVCDEELNPEYLCFSIRHAKLQLERLSTQTTISYLNKENVESLKIVLPPSEEQSVITEILLSIMHQQETLEQKLSQIQSIKKSLMQDLLTGKVRVTVN